MDNLIKRASALVLLTCLSLVSSTFAAQNRAPVAAADAYSVTINSNLIAAAPGVLANDSDPNGDVLRAVLVASTTNGVLSLNTNGGFNYRPASNFFGTDAF